jgi:hypothetical protein
MLAVLVAVGQGAPEVRLNQAQHTPGLHPLILGEVEMAEVEPHLHTSTQPSRATSLLIPVEYSAVAAVVARTSGSFQFPHFMVQYSSGIGIRIQQHQRRLGWVERRELVDREAAAPELLLQTQAPLILVTAQLMQPMYSDQRLRLQMAQRTRAVAVVAALRGVAEERADRELSS